MAWAILYSEQFEEWWDNLSEGVFLLGGDKTGRWTEWYRSAIPIADDLYDEYLAAEGLN